MKTLQTGACLHMSMKYKDSASPNFFNQKKWKKQQWITYNSLAVLCLRIATWLDCIYQELCNGVESVLNDFICSSPIN